MRPLEELCLVREATKWDRFFIGMARKAADEMSKDPSTKVGCVIVGDDREVLSLGFNGFPIGIADTAERLNDRQIKYLMIQHAERNALDLAKAPLKGATLYSTLCPCHECVKSIIQKRIKAVVFPATPILHERFGDSMQVGLDLLREAKVSVAAVNIPEESESLVTLNRHNLKVIVGALRTAADCYVEDGSGGESHRSATDLFDDADAATELADFIEKKIA